MDLQTDLFDNSKTEKGFSARLLFYTCTFELLVFRFSEWLFVEAE